MMAPSIVLDEARSFAVGSAGSNRIRSAILQVVLNLIDFDMTPQEAVDAPRVHVENDAVDLEGGTPADIARRLSEDGYRVQAWAGTNLFFGGVQVAMRTAAGDLDGGGDKRRGGAVVTVD
jgi:gamma-glutamyltranspeptidase/glutathione hydrolase